MSLAGSSIPSGVNDVENAFVSSISNLSNDRKRCHLHPTITIATGISLFINVGLVIFLILYLPKHQYKEEKGTTASALRVTDEKLINSVCLECRVLGLSRDDVLSSRSVRLLSVRDEHLCCFPEAESLWKLLNLIVVKDIMRKQKKNNRVTTTPEHPSVHLYLDTLQKDARYYKWSEEYGHEAAHVTKSIQFKNGRLYIEKAGFYNIYSFLTYKRRRDSRASTIINHSIIRKSNQTLPHSGVVLKTSVELPLHSETFTTSYVCGVVKLQSQDELYVDVSDVEAVYRYAPANFFGLYFVKSL